jgi:hypothetical protein
VTAGAMLFSAVPPVSFNMPNIGNGFLATNVGPQCSGSVGGKGCGIRATGSEGLGDRQNHLGGLHLGGVFNGISNKTVSHRARIPSVHNIQVRDCRVTEGVPSSEWRARRVGIVCAQRVGVYARE